MNVRGAAAIFTNELARFFRTAFGSILSPVLTTSLYLVVFGAAIGGRMDPAQFGGASYGAFIVPGLSDRLGRRPVSAVAGLLGVFIPLGALWASGDSVWPYHLAFAAGAAITGVFPLAMATVPSEIVPPGLTATALSLTMGTSEIIGGVLAPTLAGRAADAYGLTAPLWIVAGLAIAVGLIALLLRETAPQVLARRAKARGELARAA